MQIAVAIAFGLSLLALLSLMRLELGLRSHEPIAMDEMFFSACAVRGLATGEIPSAGCSDNKAPLIFLIHQVLNQGGTPYNVLAVKTAAFGVVFAIIVLVAWLAFRVRGGVAAAGAAALVMLALVSDSQLLALKTETVGAVFTLLSLILCSRSKVGRCRWLATGVALGVAITAKQTYAFAVPALLVWCWMTAERPAGGSHGKTFALNAVHFIGGLVLPLLAFFVVFYLQGKSVDFLTSTFLYPSIYGPAHAASWLRRATWRLGDVCSDLALVPVLPALFAASLPRIGAQLCSWRRNPAERAPALLPIALVALGLMLVAFVSPVYSRYHLIPAWVVMAAVGGVVISELGAAAVRAGMVRAVQASSALVVFSLVVAVSSWFSNGHMRSEQKLSVEYAIHEGSGEYGYVLGMRPEFYVRNGLIPASDVQFPWALSGMPPNWFYAIPEAGSTKGKLLDAARSRNTVRLMNDFSRTPPSYIFVGEAMSRAKSSSRIADVPGFDEYLLEHCSNFGRVPENKESHYLIYRCNSARDRAGGMNPADHVPTILPP